MSKKKKDDLATELADLLMDDDSSLDLETTKSPSGDLPTQDRDYDPTMAISKNTPTPSSVNEKTSSIRIDTEKSVATMHIERGVGGRQETKRLENEKTVEKSEVDSDATAQVPTQPRSTSEPTAFGDPSALKQLSGIFNPPPPPQQPAALPPRRAPTELVLSAEGALIQSEQLRIAQERILELEKVVEVLRTENEQLVAAGETLRNRSDDLKAQVDQARISTKEKLEITNEELVVLKTGMAAKTDEIQRLKLKIEELETRLQGDLKKIRVRERELENRLEIAKLETHALMKNKDEVILDLKRKIDQLEFELENYRNKSRELNKVIEDNRERVRRTVKALRLALTMLEGEEAEVTPLKKAE